MELSIDKDRIVRKRLLLLAFAELRDPGTPKKNKSGGRPLVGYIGTTGLGA